MTNEPKPTRKHSMPSPLRKPEPIQKPDDDKPEGTFRYSDWADI